MNTSYLDQSLSFDKELLKMPVKECEEEMISLTELFLSKNIPIVFNSEVDVNAKTPKQFFLRKSVAESLTDAAAELLGHKMLLNIEDAYRSLQIQKIKFLEEVKRLQEDKPQLTTDEAKAMANTYIAGIPLLAAHTAGAAIDVTLIYKDSGKAVDFGADYHMLDERSVTDNPAISEEGKKNRKFFVEIMQKHGLTNYPFEYWHFSRGDVCAAYINKEPQAVYAPVAINPSTGKITAFVASRSLRTYF